MSNQDFLEELKKLRGEALATKQLSGLDLIRDVAYNSEKYTDAAWEDVKECLKREMKRKTYTSISFAPMTRSLDFKERAKYEKEYKDCISITIYLDEDKVKIYNCLLSSLRKRLREHNLESSVSYYRGYTGGNITYGYDLPQEKKQGWFR